MAGRIRDADIVEVRERNRIDEVVGEYVALRRAGADSLKGLCPFHDEKSPSFNVRPGHGTYHCFGCGEGGSVVDFMMKIEHLGFVEAVERLAERVGIQLTYTGGGSSVQRDRGTRARLVEVNRLAQEFYAEQLSRAEARPAREFLTQRGFTQQVAGTFGCGFAPAGWDQLTKHLLGRGFSVEELVKAGVSREGQRGPIDRFHRRLLWPIRDLGGDVVGFGARRLFDDDRVEAKYLNTAETPLYRKSQVLFGLDLAKREIARRRQVVVVEGYTDVMAMHLAGVPTALASCGTAFGTEHISVLRRLLMDDFEFHGEVIFIFDGDEAGQKAALKAFDDEQRFATQTFIAIAPDGMDPCELRQARGDAAVRDLVARRQPLFTFAVRTLLAEHDLDTAEGRVEALRRTVPLVAQIKNVSLRDEYARQLAGWVGWEDIATVRRRVREAAGESVQRRGGRTRKPSSADNGTERPPRDDVRLQVQREVLKAVLQEPAMTGPVYDALPTEAFTHPAYAQVHAAVLAAGGTAAGCSGPEWVDAVAEHCPQRSLLTELAVETLRVKGSADEDARYIGSLLASLQATVVGGQVAEIKSRLQRISPLDDADSYHQLFGDLVALEQYYRALRERAMGAQE
ncbi:MAG: DNA primase [Pseudonocardiales bacterium]|nr:DNA primase [Pseudonocardiales bacterium]MBV9030516.1 DNA primase [Pseudonocardiales bacterium]